MAIPLTSDSNEWHTPQDFYDRLNEEFQFTLDAAATEENAKCERFFTETDNGLTQSRVSERVWCNPPYGRTLGQWIKKAATSKADVAVMLIPARTDTKAWHRWIFGNPKCEVRFVAGRLKFTGGGQESEQVECSVRKRDSRVQTVIKDAPFASAVVIFRGCKIFDSNDADTVDGKAELG